jgi:hypothetical protein
MSFRSISLFFFFMCASSLFAQQDSSAVLGRIREHQLQESLFAGSVYRNPAVHYYVHDSSLTELMLKGDYKKQDKATFLQDGDGREGYTFNVSSFMKLDPSTRVWGSAYYKNGTKKNVKWNESSDFSIIYPYVMADSIGGDLSSEEYYFSGGYAHKFNRLTWGIEGNYRALLEYRNVDPRPKNISSDLNVSTGISVPLNGNYSAGIALSLQKYKQTNEVEFLSELGAARVYHFTGLGMDYTRFSGGMTDTYYNGQSYGASVQLLPVGKSGFYSSLSFRQFSLEKIISSLNELPLANVSEQTLSSKVAYRQFNGDKEWGIKGAFLYKNRTGTENLFGDPASNIYPQIGKVEQYGNQQTSTLLSVYYSGAALSSYRFFLMPGVGYESLTMSYKYPSRSIDHSALSAHFTSEITRMVKKSLFRIGAGFTYLKDIDSKMKLDDISEGGVKRMLESNYSFLASDQAFLSITPRWDYALPGNKAFLIKAEWTHGWYTKQVSSDYLQISLGLAF